jgi:hypothetical protein
MKIDRYKLIHSLKRQVHSDLEQPVLIQVRLCYRIINSNQLIIQSHHRE